MYYTCQCSYRHQYLVTAAALFIDFTVPGYSGSCWVHLQCLFMIIAVVPSVTKSGYSSSISYTQCYKIWLQQQYQLHSVLQNLVTAAVSVTLSVTKSGYSSSISYTQCYKIWLQQQYQLHSVLQNLVTAAVSVTLLWWQHLVILN